MIDQEWEKFKEIRVGHMKGDAEENLREAFIAGFVCSVDKMMDMISKRDSDGVLALNNESMEVATRMILELRFRRVRKEDIQ